MDVLENRIVSVVFFLAAGNQQVDAIHVTQLERDTVLVCLDRKYKLYSSALTKKSVKKPKYFVQSRCDCLLYVLPHQFYSLFLFFLLFFSPENLKIVNLQGRLKSNKKLASELSFDFCIGSVGKL